MVRSRLKTIPCGRVASSSSGSTRSSSVYNATSPISSQVAHAIASIVYRDDDRVLPHSPGRQEHRLGAGVRVRREPVVLEPLDVVECLASPSRVTCSACILSESSTSTITARPIISLIRRHNGQSSRSTVFTPTNSRPRYPGPRARARAARETRPRARATVARSSRTRRSSTRPTTRAGRGRTRAIRR